MLSIDKFKKQKYHSFKRGIEFNLTYEKWLAVWGDKLDKRGRGLGKLQMCRIGDKGNYELGNVYIDTCENNSSDKFKFGFKAKKPAIKDVNKDFIQTLLDMKYSTRNIAFLTNCNQKQIMNFKNQLGPNAPKFN